MSVVVCKKSRRQFLIGAGQSLLALPILPSLFSSRAEAQAASMIHKKMMVFWFDHNTQADLWPNRSIATSAVGSSGARETLLRNLASADAFSPIMNHSLLDTLRRNDLITMVRGLEVLAGGGHGYFPAGGNLVENGGNIVQGPDNFPTFDTILEASLALYPSTTPSNVRKAVRVWLQHGGNGYLQKVGTQIQRVPSYGNDDFNYNQQRYTSASLPRLYTDVFGSLTNGTVPPQDMTNLTKTNILNRVHASYTSFRSNRRISSDDLARVDQHLSLISDLQRRYTSTQSSGSACTVPSSPLATISDPTVFTPIYLSLMALAFKCNLTKVGSLYFDSHDPRWLPGLSLGAAPDFHAGIHGDHGVAVKENCYRTYNKWGMDQIATHFLASLNEQEGNSGRTYLDNMATVILSQMGYENLNGGSGHSSFDMHQMIIGSMGGNIRSGRYVSFPINNGRLVPLNAFWITMFQLMGVPASEYSRHTVDGQGFGRYVSSAGNPYASRFYSPLTEILNG